MDSVTIIVAALGAGAAAGLSDTTATAVKDAYTQLKELVAARMAGSNAAEVALAGYQNDPDTWEAPLTKALLEMGTGADTELLEAAQTVLRLLGRQPTSKYRTTVHDSYAFQIGDHGEQVNHFGQ
ncbi:hypothetical protein E1264_20005 [Actinomadura sp. KC216]|uniref:hypothetical protein n=1 Tax=Actinomadura sp. KC216 TaxID=2530370 RepID=UPI001045870D|nr:hypothetical protein [Actinomadura sp. KC216]TDB85817.1 hypothetical protein E1264_20005 [Actinomadura sp. KC216]